MNSPINRPSRARRISGWVSVVLMLSLTVALLIALELTGRLFAYGIVHWRQDPRVSADGYFGATWTGDYYDEFLASAPVDWRPYVYWRRRPFSGRFIHVDADGIRRTWKPGALPPSHYRIVVMGGSTVWGTGARDEQTLPSHIAKELASRGHPVEVINYGESGYVTRQDVSALVTRLHRDDVPDMVIFYGGINDVFAAFQSNIAGIPQNESNRRVEFNALLPESAGKVLRILMSGTQFVSSTIRRRLLQRTREASPPPPDPALARAVIDDYCAEVRTVGALGREYGFEAMFYWQPQIFTKASLTAYEQAQSDRYNDAREFFRLAYDRLAAAPCGGSVHDVSGVFQSERRPVYLDAFHLTETGNQIAAREMMASIVSALQALSRPPHAPGR